MKVASHGSRWARRAAFIAVALIALAVRLPQLGERPMHTDETINAYIVGQSLAGDPFSYDPQDRHGPALAALALPMVKLQGARSFSELTESELRLTPVFAGITTILLFAAAVEMFGFLPCLIAALLFAVAPLPVYYDRYFIHESLFCAATSGFMVTAWRALETRAVWMAAAAGACAALMFACKETAIIHLLALAVAAVVFKVRNLRGKELAGGLIAGPLLAAAGAFIALTIVLFTWFGRNWKGPAMLLRVAPHVVARAAGQGHAKAFWYYGRLLAGGWSGGLLCVLACVGLFITTRRRDASAYQWLAYYAVLLGLFYSLIPYKTPWLALNLWLPLALLVATAIDGVWRLVASKMQHGGAVAVCSVCSLLIAALMAHDTRERVFHSPAEETNPYAYAHTTSDILSLPTEIADVARQAGIVKPRIAVIAADPWPLPWYLRRFEQVGFYQPGQQVAKADFYVTSTDASEHYASQLQNSRPEFFGVRPGVLVLLWPPPTK